jgi:hypothetical protein
MPAATVGNSRYLYATLSGSIAGGATASPMAQLGSSRRAALHTAALPPPTPPQRRLRASAAVWWRWCGWPSRPSRHAFGFG